LAKRNNAIACCGFAFIDRSIEIVGNHLSEDYDDHGDSYMVSVDMKVKKEWVMSELMQVQGFASENLRFKLHNPKCGFPHPVDLQYITARMKHYLAY